MGLPTAHHIVVYMLAQLPQEHKEIKVTMQRSEVDAAAWLDAQTVAEVIQSDEYGKTRNVAQKYFRYVCLFAEWQNVNCASKICFGRFTINEQVVPSDSIVLQC